MVHGHSGTNSAVPVAISAGTQTVIITAEQKVTWQAKTNGLLVIPCVQVSSRVKKRF